MGTSYISFLNSDTGTAHILNIEGVRDNVDDVDDDVLNVRF